jgi:hypothetical protein
MLDRYESQQLKGETSEEKAHRVILSSMMSAGRVPLLMRSPRALPKRALLCWEEFEVRRKEGEEGEEGGNVRKEEQESAEKSD